jgi:hypothetical protein
MIPENRRPSRGTIDGYYTVICALLCRRRVGRMSCQRPVIVYLAPVQKQAAEARNQMTFTRLLSTMTHHAASRHTTLQQKYIFGSLHSQYFCSKWYSKVLRSTIHLIVSCMHEKWTGLIRNKKMKEISDDYQYLLYQLQSIRHLLLIQCMLQKNKYHFIYCYKCLKG